MSSTCTSSVPKEDVVFPRMLYCDWRCSQTLIGLSPALPGALLCNATRRLGDRKLVILCQRVQGSIRAVRVVRNTQVFQTETRVVADVVFRLVDPFGANWLDSQLPCFPGVDSCECVIGQDQCAFLFHYSFRVVSLWAFHGLRICEWIAVDRR